MCRNTCLGSLALLAVLILVVNAGCSGPEHPPAVSQASLVTMTISPPTTFAASATPIATAIPSPDETEVPQAVSTTIVPVTPGPSPTPARISEAALNARIVDARNKLEMFIDSDVTDTEIVHTGSPTNCDVKMSKEIGYLVDMNTGEATFIKGDYWSINANLFSDPMRKDREYIIIHTHPRMWVTCGGSGIYSLYTFSIGDLSATANLTEQGYHIQKLIAIADKDYRIWPYETDGWKTEADIMRAVDRIEARVGKPFSYYDPVFEQTFYDVDNLMPLLAKELDYHYTVNNNIIN